MYYLMRDDVLTYAGTTPESIIGSINKNLANFRTYGGLNFEVDGLTILVKFGRLSTNLRVRCEKEDEVDTFLKATEKNF